MKKRWLSLFLALCLVLCLTPAAQVRAISDSPAPYTDYFLDEEWAVLKLVNQERSAEGLHPLTGFPLLQDVARLRATELVELFSHTRPDGSSCFSAYDELGIRSYASGENIAAGYRNPESVMTGWMNSSGHRANILDPDYESIGVGYHYDNSDGYGFHWCQNFRSIYSDFTAYRVVMPNGNTFPAGTGFDEMDIYLVLEHDGDNFDHYLPLTQELVSGFTGEGGTATVSFDLLGLSGSFDVTLEKDPIENPFTDVPADAFYHDPVLWALENGITTGASDSTFNPDGECLRAQVVTFLWRAAGEPEPIRSDNPFVDVIPTDFYYNAVLWAVENGITNGADATHFNPMGVCNRAQVVTFLYRAFHSPAVEVENNPFSDVPDGTWYTAPILWAVENGITNGLSATQFGPNQNCNRAQIVTFLYRAYN